MRNLVKFYILMFAIFLAFPKSARAEVNTSVNVSNNGEGSSNSVNIENNVNTGGKSSSSNTSNVKTRIRIETNGQVKEYNSDKPEDIKIESEEGGIKVHVNNEGNPSSTQASEKENVKQEKNNLKKKIEEKQQAEKSKMFKFDLQKFFEDQFKFIKGLFRLS